MVEEITMKMRDASVAAKGDVRKPEDDDELEVDIDEKLKIIEELTEKVDNKDIVQFD